jgi:primase-polymerase (primpol)-like protein
VSKTGVHILAYGDLPPSGRRRNGVELYPTAHYFVVTGEHLAGTPTTIQERTEALQTLYASLARPEPPRRSTARPAVPSSSALDDVTLLAKARAAVNGAQFSSLWNGDVSAYGGDESAADLALCNHLAFWTGRDPLRMDRLFRQSGLMRSKWDSRRGDTTYGQLTIDRAIADTSAVYEPVAAVEDSPTNGHASDTPPINQPHTLAELEDTFRTWIRDEDPVPQRAVLATYVANRHFDGDPVCSSPSADRAAVKQKSSRRWLRCPT